jgi:hypothetical protein
LEKKKKKKETVADDLIGEIPAPDLRYDTWVSKPTTLIASNTSFWLSSLASYPAFYAFSTHACEWRLIG